MSNEIYLNEEDGSIKEIPRADIIKNIKNFNDVYRDKCPYGYAWHEGKPQDFPSLGDGEVLADRFKVGDNEFLNLWFYKNKEEGYARIGSYDLGEPHNESEYVWYDGIVYNSRALNGKQRPVKISRQLTPDEYSHYHYVYLDGSMGGKYNLPSINGIYLMEFVPNGSDVIDTATGEFDPKATPPIVYQRAIPLPLDGAVERHPIYRVGVILPITSEVNSLNYVNFSQWIQEGINGSADK